jgi:hypothetical protein
MRPFIVPALLFLILLTSFPTLQADLLPADLQPLVATGQLQSLEREGSQYKLTVGAEYFQASQQEQRAIIRRVLEVVSSSDRTAGSVSVVGPDGGPLGVLSVGSFRRNPNGI